MVHLAHLAHAAQAEHAAETSGADRQGGTPASSPVIPAHAPVCDAEYDAILATLAASARGRAFLAEYGRRNRGADTTTVLAAIDHIGAALRDEAAPDDAPEYLQLGLMAMAGLIAAVENDMSALSTGHETTDSARPRVQRVIGTLRDLGDCVQVMLDSWPTKPTPQAAAPEPAAHVTASTSPAPAFVETPPAPSADHGASPTDAFAAGMAALETGVVALEVDDTAAERPVGISEPPAATPHAAPQNAAPQTMSREDALAALRSLSDAELIALFT